MKTLLTLAFALASPVSATTVFADDPAPGRALLQARCYKCHGANGAHAGRFDLDAAPATWIDNGLIEPGNPEASPLYQKIRDRIMPADGNYLNAEELAQVADWIRTQTARPDGPSAPPTSALLTDEQVVAKLKAYLAAVGAIRGEDTRAFSLVDLARAGKSATELEIYRQALTKTLNSLSTRPELVKPEAIDEGRLLLAVNIKSLGWTSELWSQAIARAVCRELDGVNRPRDDYPLDRSTLSIFEDGERRQVKECTGRTYSTEERLQFSLSGNSIARECDEAAESLAIQESVAGRQVQELGFDDCRLLPVDAFIAQATSAAAYADFVETSLSGNSPTIDRELQAIHRPGFWSSLFGGSSILSERHALTVGVRASGVALNNRVILRKAGFPGYLWASRDFKSDLEDARDLTQHPHASPDAGEYIFTLPNGMQGYAISGPDGQLLAQANEEIALDPARVDQIVSRPASCFSCHGSSGIIAKSASETLSRGFSKFSQVEPWFAKDSAAYRATLKKLGLDRDDAIEPISYVLQKFLSHDFHAGR